MVAASGKGATATVDVPTFIFHIDILLLASAAAYILTTLPRLLAAIKHSSYFATYALREHSDDEVLRIARQQAPSNDEPKPSTSADMLYSASTTDSPVLDSRATHLIFSPPSGGAADDKLVVPTRVASWTARTHPIVVSIINYEVFPAVTFSKGGVILIIFTVLAYAGFYESNPFSDPVREGYIAMAIFPLVVAVACKNNVLTWLAGVGYEKLNWLHRAVGTLLVLSANIHGIGKINKWANSDSFYANLKIPHFRYAIVALVGIDLLYLGSRQFVRSKSYTLFLITHFAGFIAAAVGMTNHFPVTIPYVVAGVVVYAVDRTLRLARTRVTTAHIMSLPHLNNGTTHVHMPNLIRGYHAGQHVRVRVVDGHGILAYIRALAFSRPRPFTLASRPLGSGAELYIKKERGAFTTGLYRMAAGEPTSPEKSVSSVNEKGLSEIEAGVPTRAVRMLIEGPYGGPSYTIFESFSGVVLVAGGSGISFVLGVLDDLLEAHAAGRSRVCAIEIVWAIANPAALTALLPAFRPLFHPRTSPHGPLTMRMMVHYTRTGGRGPSPDPSQLPSGIHLRTGRPDLSSALNGAIDCVLDARLGTESYKASGVVAAACGPHALIGQLESVVGSLSWERWRDVGGVETVSEAFAF